MRLKRVTLAEMRDRMEEILGSLAREHQLCVITRDGHAAAVLLDPASYRTIIQRTQILSGIEEGERDFAEGRTASWEDVRADLERWRI